MTQCPSTVRMARPTDEDALLELAIINNKENGLYPLNNDKMMTMIRRATRPVPGVSPSIIGVIESEKNLIATIGIMLSQFWYTDNWHLEEIWNYVHPEHRRSEHAKNLISFSKWVSEGLGLPILIGIISSIRTEAKVRLYSRQLPSVGALFLYHGEKMNGEMQ